MFAQKQIIARRFARLMSGNYENINMQVYHARYEFVCTSNTIFNI